MNSSRLLQIRNGLPAIGVGLFKQIFDRKETQFAQQINYFPWGDLSPDQQKRIVFHKHQVMRKSGLLALLSEDKKTLVLPFDSRGFTDFLINWQHNNVPTEKEWEARSEQTLVHVDYRISPLARGHGRVAVLSWY